MQREFGVSMTPMIDVVFLLLIFFVCTASFQVAEAILPSSLALATSDQPALDPADLELERIVIEVARQQDATVLSVNSQPCPSLQRLSELLLALARVDATLPVVLDIGGDTSLGTAIDVYDRCRLAEFEKIQFAAEAAP